jgi:site-specific DNA-methyltransferase (cytosine-N4-specific)
MTTAPYCQDEHVTLYHGKALDVTRAMPDKSVDCVVTSPPYFGLRDYGHEDQYGTEETPGEYIESMVDLYREVRRVLTDDGTFWLNVGDSYGYRKNLLGIPWRVALALQDDGWTLRNDIIWSKTNAMPESVTDRLANRHEHLFLFTKSPHYWFDLDPIRKPHAEESISRASRGRATAYAAPGQTPNKRSESQPNKLGGNPGDVWEIPTKPFAGAHFATFPEELPRRCIASGCKPGGVVLDPCSGSGTTGAAAQALGRRYVGIDINADYLKLSLETRLRNAPLDLNI